MLYGFFHNLFSLLSRDFRVVEKRVYIIGSVDWGDRPNPNNFQTSSINAVWKGEARKKIMLWCAVPFECCPALWPGSAPSKRTFLELVLFLICFGTPSNSLKEQPFFQIPLLLFFGYPPHPRLGPGRDEGLLLRAGLLFRLIRLWQICLRRISPSRGYSNRIRERRRCCYRCWC